MGDRFKSGVSCKRASGRRAVLGCPAFLPAEALESRTLFSAGVVPAAGLPMLPGDVHAATNTAPTIAQAITVNSGNAIIGKTATLAVLGADDAGETKLTYTWSVTSAPTGGTATFSANARNAAKSATATFNKAGDYTLQVKIADAAGLSVTTTVTFTVAQTLTSLKITTAAGATVTPTTGLTITGAAQIMYAQGLDQFGNAMAVAPTLAWTMLTKPAGAADPSIVASGTNATLYFKQAGAYSLSIKATSGTTSLTSNIAVTVKQTVVSIRNAPTDVVNLTAATLQLPMATFVDQFGNTFVPAITWTMFGQPKGSPTVVFKTTNGVTTATFGQVGYYSINAVVTGQTNAGFAVSVNVTQALTSFLITPGTPSIYQKCDQQFTVQSMDQFGKAMSGARPAITWSTSAGSITSAGILTAPATGTSVTVTATSGKVSSNVKVTLKGAATIKTAALASLVTSLDADGSINRADMMQILRSVADGTPLTATELSDLQLIVSEATTLGMPTYVRVLANDVVNGSLANATYQGKALGNLAVGFTDTKINNLVDKWFMGTDLPKFCNTSLVYKTCSGTLFPHDPSRADESQGMLGDCYLYTALGSLADANPNVIKDMFIDNGDGTFTVRFYTGTYGCIATTSVISGGFADNYGIADYITVNRSLPTSTLGMMVYANHGNQYDNANNSLWLPLLEKAYAQWNQTGKAGRDGTNDWAAIQGGAAGTVDAQVLGYNSNSYITTRIGEQVIIDALAANKAVTIGTNQWTGTNMGLYATHSYTIIGYDAKTDTFSLYNPWGTDHPGPLTWAQLQSACLQVCVCDLSGFVPSNSLAPKAQLPALSGAATGQQLVVSKSSVSPLSGMLGEAAPKATPASPFAVAGLAATPAEASSGRLALESLLGHANQSVASLFSATPIEATFAIDALAI